jgi:hypothetical protein
MFFGEKVPGARHMMAAKLICINLLILCLLVEVLDQDEVP